MVFFLSAIHIYAAYMIHKIFNRNTVFFSKNFWKKLYISDIWKTLTEKVIIVCEGTTNIFICCNDSPSLMKSIKQSIYDACIFFIV